MGTKYIGFDNTTLDRQPQVYAGDEIRCPRCTKIHRLEGGLEDGKPSELLLFYQCSGAPYLAAVAGRLVIDLPADVSGDIPPPPSGTD